MKPDKALELIQRYSELTWAIRACANRIAEAINQCPGLDGKRQERRRSIETPPYEYAGAIGSEENEKSTHLHEWYRPEMVESYYGPDHRQWNTVGESEREECPHCYAAHLAIQDPKVARKALGTVKAAMTRTTPKPAILNRRPDRDEGGY